MCFHFSDIDEQLSLSSVVKNDIKKWILNHSHDFTIKSNIFGFFFVMRINKNYLKFHRLMRTFSFNRSLKVKLYRVQWIMDCVIIKLALMAFLLSNLSSKKIRTRNDFSEIEKFIEISRFSFSQENVEGGCALLEIADCPLLSLSCPEAAVCGAGSEYKTFPDGSCCCEPTGELQSFDDDWKLNYP